MRGQKPQPTMLDELHGRPGKQAKRALPEPKPVGNLDVAPDWLTEAQREWWDYVLRHAPPCMLKRLDRGALVTWIVAEDLHRQATIAQSKVGLLVASPKQGVDMQSPYLAIINKQAVIMLRAAAELGFSPTSRPRIFMSPTDGAPLAPPPEYSADAAPADLDTFLAEKPFWH